MKLVYFGRLSQEKGLVNFIEALTDNEIDFTFTIIGEGSDKNRIERAIEDNNLSQKVFVKPKIDQRELYKLLSEYDIFVLPSLWYENAPLSIVEAAGMGLGLFLSGHGGILEIGRICNCNHFFNPFDKTDIALKLKQLYNDFSSNNMPKADNEVLSKLFGEAEYNKNLNHFLEI